MTPKTHTEYKETTALIYTVSVTYGDVPTLFAVVHIARQCIYLPSTSTWPIARRERLPMVANVFAMSRLGD